jgi:uncharacterized integral membrane protein
MARRRTNDQSEAPENDALDLARRFWLPLVLVVVAVLFIVQNTEQTRFNFPWFKFDWPLWIMLADRSGSDP